VVAGLLSLCPVSIRTLGGRLTWCTLGYFLGRALPFESRGLEPQHIVRSRPGTRLRLDLQPSMLLQPHTGAGRRLPRSPTVDEARRQASARRLRSLVSSLPCRQPRAAAPICVGRRQDLGKRSKCASRARRRRSSSESLSVRFAAYAITSVRLKDTSAAPAWSRPTSRRSSISTLTTSARSLTVPSVMRNCVGGDVRRRRAAVPTKRASVYGAGLEGQKGVSLFIQCFSHSSSNAAAKSLMRSLNP
jgi:hypothetical protein